MKCLVTKLGVVIDNPNLEKLDLTVRNYISAIGGSPYEQQLSEMYDTLKSLGVIDDFVGIFPVLGRNLEQARINLLNPSQIISVGNLATYDNGCITSDNSTSIIDGNIEMLVDFTNYTYTSFACYQTASRMYNLRVNGVTDGTSLLCHGQDYKWNYKASQCYYKGLGNSVANQGIGSATTDKIFGICTVSPNSGNPSHKLIVSAKDTPTPSTNGDGEQSEFTNFTGKVFTAWNSDNTFSKVYFSAVMRKRLYNYDEETRNAICACLRKFCVDVKGLDAL